jgi:hypothetical protein
MTRRNAHGTLNTPHEKLFCKNEEPFNPRGNRQSWWAIALMGTSRAEPACLLLSRGLRTDSREQSDPETQLH